MIIPVVLAGGVGSRLWPVSRQLFPKQFIAFGGEELSLFQNTLERLSSLEKVAPPVVVCNDEHRFLVAEQLRELGIHAGGDSGEGGEAATVMLEPVGRNTAPAVAMAALTALRRGEDPVLLVLPADHVIEDRQALHGALNQGRQLAEEGRLVTFGVVPTRPDIGYGYIRRGEALGEAGAFAVDSFVEKPDLETANTYLRSGEYYWNSGMFMFRASRFLAELEKYGDDILQVCRSASDQLKKDLDFQRIPEKLFAECRSESVDYAVMEKTDQGAVVPLDARWSDLGSWQALWESGEQQEGSNVTSGDVFLHDVKNSYVRAGSRMVAAIGIEDAVVVETSDAVLVSTRDQSQQIKTLVQQLEKEGRGETVSHPLVYRPWGSYESLDIADGYQIKHIRVKPGGALSLQMHHHRAEHWIIVRGTARVTCGEREFMLEENESTFIPRGSKHRLENPGTEWVELVEVQVGSYLGEDDIVRFDDVYGRETEK